MNRVLLSALLLLTAAQAFAAVTAADAECFLRECVDDLPGGRIVGLPRAGGVPASIDWIENPTAAKGAERYLGVEAFFEEEPVDRGACVVGLSSEGWKWDAAAERLRKVAAGQAGLWMPWLFVDGKFVSLALVRPDAPEVGPIHLFARDVETGRLTDLGAFGLPAGKTAGTVSRDLPEALRGRAFQFVLLAEAGAAYDVADFTLSQTRDPGRVGIAKDLDPKDRPAALPAPLRLRGSAIDGLGYVSGELYLSVIDGETRTPFVVPYTLLEPTPAR